MEDESGIDPMVSMGEDGKNGGNKKEKGVKGSPAYAQGWDVKGGDGVVVDVDGKGCCLLLLCGERGCKEANEQIKHRATFNKEVLNQRATHVCTKHYLWLTNHWEETCHVGEGY